MIYPDEFGIIISESLLLESKEQSPFNVIPVDGKTVTVIGLFLHVIVSAVFNIGREALTLTRMLSIGEKQPSLLPRYV
jgi:hypothetical protein